MPTHDHTIVSHKFVIPPKKFQPHLSQRQVNVSRSRLEIGGAKLELVTRRRKLVCETASASTVAIWSSTNRELGSQSLAKSSLLYALMTCAFLHCANPLITQLIGWHASGSGIIEHVKLGGGDPGKGDGGKNPHGEEGGEDPDPPMRKGGNVARNTRRQSLMRWFLSRALA